MVWIKNKILQENWNSINSGCLVAKSSDPRHVSKPVHFQHFAYNLLFSLCNQQHDSASEFQTVKIISLSKKSY